MRTSLFVMALLGTATTATAQMESFRLAGELGTVIGSETLCGLSLKQDAIASYIEANAPKSDMSFPQTLTMMIQGTEFNNSSLSGSAKTAHCAAVTLAARQFGFID
jgi:hypothetical protein